MKILQILPALNQGGVEYYILENSRFINEYADSYVISAGGRLVPELLKNGSKHFELPIEKKNLKSLFQVGKIVKIIEEVHPDIIHIHSRLQAWLIYFALKKLSYRPKVVTTAHSFNSISRYSRQILRADKVIAVSQFLKDYLAKNYPQEAVDKIEVITQGIDDTKFNRTVVPSTKIQEKIKSFGINIETDKILLLPGRITRFKGIPALIDLMYKLKQDGLHNVKALIVGEYNSRNQNFYNEMQEKISKLSLTDTIFWFGTCDDMPSIYTMADISFSLTSKPESYGRTVLESLACGTPMIGYNYGGVQENLEKYFPLGAITPNDPTALYNAVITLLSTEPEDREIPAIDDNILSAQKKLQDLYESLLR